MVFVSISLVMRPSRTAFREMNISLHCILKV